MFIGLTAGIMASQSRPFSPFSIRQLFNGSEAGVWYDPSDLSTLFQDTAGTTPVTTAGQTVGLMLDKSQGLTLGPELVTNGTFDTDTDWTKGTGWTIGSGVASKASGSSGTITQPVSGLTAGSVYAVSVDVNTFVSGGSSIRLTFGGSTGESTTTPPDTLTNFFVATSEIQSVSVFVGGLATAEIDNISVKELPGNHATQPTAAARPTYQTDGTLHWLEFDGVDDFMASNAIDFTTTDEMSVFAGVQKNNTATFRVIVEASPTGNGTFYLSAQANDIYQYSPKGTVAVFVDGPTSFPSPSKNVVSGFSKIATPIATIRVDGVDRETVTSSQGTGNFLSQALNIGARSNGSLGLNGRIYGLIVRAAIPTPDVIDQTEAYIAEKTGVTL